MLDYREDTLFILPELIRRQMIIHRIVIRCINYQVNKSPYRF